MKLFIASDGSCTSVYDEMLDLRFLGESTIRRASHVEPTIDGQLSADLSPVGGPQLGPFLTRSEALAAELAWLDGWFSKSHEVLNITQP